MRQEFLFVKNTQTIDETIPKVQEIVQRVRSEQRDT